MKILVTGATGHIGHAATLALLNSGHQVTAFVRDPSRAQDLHQAGARLFTGDLENQAALNDAASGQDALFWLTPPNLRSPDLLAWQNQIAANAIRAAQQNNIQRIVNLSGFGIHQPHLGKLLQNFLHLESLFDRSGLPVLHLRPGWFMENLLPQAASIQNEGRLYVAIAPTVSLPLIATADIGAVAAQRLSAPTFSAGVEDLYGPELLTGPEVAAVLSQHFGKPLTWVALPAEAMNGIFTSLGATPQNAELYAGLFADFNHPSGPYSAPQPNATRTPTTLATFAKGAF